MEVPRTINWRDEMQPREFRSLHDSEFHFMLYSYSTQYHQLPDEMQPREYSCTVPSMAVPSTEDEARLPDEMQPVEPHL